MKGKKTRGGLSPLAAMENSTSLPQQNRTGGEVGFTTRLVACSPAPAGAVPSVTKGTADETRTGSQSEAAATSNVSHGMNNEGMSYAVADAVPPEEDREISGIRISACVGIKYPFTEEGKSACLSRACPKNKECKICCKDWSKE